MDQIVALTTDQVAAFETADLRAMTMTQYNAFEGEDWELELPQATYLVEGPELSLYFSADAGPMPETYAALGDARAGDQS